jgi:hypothetical protein
LRMIAPRSVFYLCSSRPQWIPEQIVPSLGQPGLRRFRVRHDRYHELCSTADLASGELPRGGFPGGIGSRVSRSLK